MSGKSYANTGALLAGIRECYASGNFTDYELRCGGRVFKVHRIIITSQSKMFQKACSSGFKEAEQGFMELQDDPIYVEALLRAIYTYDYSADDYKDYDHPLLFNMEVYILAEKYDVASVKQIAAIKIRHCIRGQCDTPSDLAVRTTAITLAYHNTPENDWLRKIVAGYAARDFTNLLRIEEFRDFLDPENGIPDFVWDMTHFMLNAYRRRGYKVYELQFGANGDRETYWATCRLGSIEITQDKYPDQNAVRDYASLSPETSCYCSGSLDLEEDYSSSDLSGSS